MLVRVVLVVLVACILGTAAWMSMSGVWGESTNVVSTRTGSSGGGYGLGGGRIK